MLMMVKQPERRTDRCFLPVGSNGVTLVQVPAQRRPSSSAQLPAQVRLRGASGEDAETEAKRIRISGSEEASTNRESASESCDQTGSSRGFLEEGVSAADRAQQVELESSEDNRAAELASAGGLKVTIQRSSESREFGEKEASSERLTCHICHCSCPTVQAFQQHMSEAEHLRRLQHITQSVAVSQHTRGRCGAAERWCDVCQSHFTGDVILHRRSTQHKDGKKSSRPFCSVCRRHFRTPRKFVEHMKSREHKLQVELEEAQDEEMITVDAVGCFESESDTSFTSRTEEGGGVHREKELGERLGLKELGDGCDRNLVEELEEGDEELGHEGGIGEKHLGVEVHGIEHKEGGEEETSQEGEDNLSSEESGGKDAQRGGKEGSIGDKDRGKEAVSEDRGGIDVEELMEEVQTEEESGSQFSPQTAHGDSYLVPVSGFFCRLCSKFFFRETTRDEHQRCQSHLSRVLQSDRRRRQQQSQASEFS